MDKLAAELKGLASEGIALTSGEGEIDDVLTHALFPQIGLKFWKTAATLMRSSQRQPAKKVLL